MLESDLQLHIFIYAVMAIVIVVLFSKKSYRPNAPTVFTSGEIQELLTSWKPRPLIPKRIEPEHQLDLDTVPIISAVEGRYIIVNDKRLLNCSSCDYFGFSRSSEPVRKACLDTLHACGVGSCGPRGFYGTFDVHFNFENRIAQFLGFEEAALYASAIATTASVIPAFATRDDYIIADECVKKSIRMGNYGSRASVIYFRHNDMCSLEESLQHVRTIQKKKNQKPNKARCYIIVEGIYNDYGTLCNLREVVALAKQYRFRVILDDSQGLGVLGQTGRGSLEHWGLKPTDISIYCADVHVFGCLGGICCGRKDLIRFQRINSSGYVYSASNPPLLVSAGIASIEELDQHPEMIRSLQKKSFLAHSLFKDIKQFYIEGYENSPVIIARLKPNYKPEEELEEQQILQKIVDKTWDQGIAITRGKYSRVEDSKTPSPRIRISISLQHTEDEIQKLADAFKQAVNETLPVS